MQRNALYDRHIVIGLLILIALTVFNTVRASELPVTIDEARTYFENIRFGVSSIANSFHGQNHTLQSILSFYSTDFFGLSLLTLRLGSVLGGVIYVLACIRLSRTYSRGLLLFVLTLLALTINPMVLDFAVLARGYSLALAFFAAALAVAANRLQDRPEGQAWKKTLISALFLSCFFSLSVASNFAFAFANTALLIVYAVWSSMRLVAWRKVAIHLVILAAPGAVLYLAINPAILKMSTATFYFGSASWQEFYSDLLEILFRDPNAIVPFPEVFRLARFIPALLSLVVLLYALVLIHQIVVARRTTSSSTNLDQNAKNWLFMVLVFGLTILFHTVDQWISGRPLPQNRTGIFLVPLATLIIASSIEGLRGFRLRSPGPASGDILFKSGTLLYAVMVLAFVACLRMSWVYVWRFDAGTPEVANVVSSYSREHGVRHVGVEWHLVPAMRFYPMINLDSTYPEIRELRNESQAEPESLFVLAHNSPLMAPHRYSVIYQHPFSHVVVAVRN